MILISLCVSNKSLRQVEKRGSLITVATFIYFRSVENVMGLTSFLFTRSQDVDVLRQQTLIDRLQSQQAAGHTTSQQAAGGEQTRLGLLGKRT